LKTMFEFMEGLDGKEIVYAFADCGFMDKDVCDLLLKDHEEYFAQYSFADGFPYGTAFEIVSKDIIPALRTLLKEEDPAIGRDSLFTVIQKDINAFDIETTMSQQDHRLLRISTAADSRQNIQQIHGALDLQKKPEYQDKKLWEILVKETALLRQVPKFFQLQIAASCSQSCSYCPYPSMNPELLTDFREMSVTQLGKICKEAEQLSEHPVFSLSLWGEPSRHSNIVAMVGTVLEVKDSRLLIETSGLGWSQQVLEELAKIGKGRIEWIVSLDCLSPALYRTIRGEGFQEAYDCVDRLEALFSPDVYVQAVRMKENEEDLEKFYPFWKEKLHGNIIVQKYDFFSGKLPQKKIADLSPVTRFPCWHLKRELCILVDGTVARCREDIQRNHSIGNVFDESLAEIWKKGDQLHQKHASGIYPDICGKCDEYYTFNY
jgi:spiro-SPASM protein